MIRAAHLLALGTALVAPLAAQVPAAETPRFVVTFPAAKSATPLDGRLLLMLSADSSDEPRFQIGDQEKTQLIFGANVTGWAPGRPATIDATTLGYPLDNLRAVPAGRYRVQALLNRYQTFHLANGKIVKLPPDRGEGQQWNRKPGNLYSTPVWINWNPKGRGVVRVIMNQD